MTLARLYISQRFVFRTPEFRRGDWEEALWLFDGGGEG